MKIRMPRHKKPEPKGLKKFSAIFLGLTFLATFITAAFEWLRKFKK